MPDAARPPGCASRSPERQVRSGKARARRSPAGSSGTSARGRDRRRGWIRSRHRRSGRRRARRASRTADMTPRQRGLSTPPSSGRSSISKRIGAAVAADALEGDDDDGLVLEDAVRQARDQALVLVAPQRREGEALQFAPVDRAEPRAGEPEDGFAARILLEDEGVGEQRLDVGRLDFGARRARGVQSRSRFQYWNSAIDPSCFMPSCSARSVVRCAIGEQNGALR